MRPAAVASALLLGLAALALAGPFEDLVARFEREKGKPYADRIKTVQAIADLGTEQAVAFLAKVIADDKDRTLQLNTIHSLARIPLRSAFDTLIAQWRDGPEDNRGTVFHALCWNREEELPRDIVEEVLGGKDQSSRSNLIRYLGRRGDPRFLKEAERFLAEFPNGASSLVSVLVQILKPESARLLVRVYDDGRNYDRERVPEAFAAAGEAVLAVLFEVIEKDAADMAGTAAVIAGRAKLAMAEPAVLDRLAKANPKLRVVLIETLGAIGAKSGAAKDALLAALGEKDEAVVAAAIRALRGVPVKAAIPRLIDLLDKGSRDIRVEAQVTLERMTGQQFGERIDLWRKWWKHYGGGFRPEDVKPPDPDALDQAQVNLAIDKGAEALKRIRGEKEPWVYASHRTGTTALVILALHAAGTDLKDRSMRAGLTYVLKAPVPDRTYETALVAMALEAIDRKKFKRRILECGRRLVETQLESGMWGYPTGNGDHSNTQYAVLGLRAAARSGMKVPQRVWRSVLLSFYRTRCKDGGWPYVPSPTAASSSSMTAAGVTCLMCEAGNPATAERTVIVHAAAEATT